MAVRLSLQAVKLYLEGEVIGEHQRSYVPADVVLDPAHARALRLAREAKRALRAGDYDLGVPDLSRYDEAVGAL